MAESLNLFVSAMDSATSGMIALHAEWHSGIDENNFSGVSNWRLFSGQIMVIWANQVTRHSMWWDMLENTPFILSPFSTKTGKPSWVELAQQIKVLTLLSFPFEISTPTTMLSFCAKPISGVAESIRISYGFCNFGHDCPSCRTTFWNRCKQILRRQ